MLTLAQIHQGISKELTFLDEAVESMAVVADVAAEAEAAYKSEYAKARLSVRALSKEKLTVDEVGDRALDICEELHLNYLLATNRLTVAREALRASQARLDGYRSLLVSIRGAGG